MDLKNTKNWNVETEKVLSEINRKYERFEFNLKTKKKIYSIDTPPPYINRPVHIGQAITYCYMDFFARFKRMKNYEVLFPLGLDRNGLPIEVAAEKKFNISAFNISRKKFLDYCKKMLDETGSETKDTFAKLGVSFTSYSEGNHVGSVYFTDSEEYRALTQETFIDLYKKGLIYEDMRVTNWDSALKTTIADSEIEYKEVNSSFNFVEWQVKETGEKIIIGTTRPELICTCGMVIFNPGDERFKHLEGKTAITPLFEKEVRIKSHPLADPEKGSGIAMMCSAGDLSDIQFFREMGLKPVIAIDIDGKMNSHAGFLEGLKVKDARRKIIESLEENNLLKSRENVVHKVPVSERSGVEIEFIEMPEFYLKQLEFKKDLKEITNKIKFYPESSKKILHSWIDSVSIDWPISRRRFYATEIPLWYFGDFVAVPRPGKYYRPWDENVPEDADVFKDGKKIGNVSDGDFKNLEWEGEERVFDTWMDSSISELYILNYKKDMDFFEKSYPATLRPQGKEIVRTWLYYTLLRGHLETGKPAFEDVWIHQHILDEKGRKMSKSLGNIIDPQQLLRDYGSEPIRLWASLEGDLSRQDLSCSEERIKAELKTLNKLLNLSKFVMLFDKPDKPNSLVELDKLFIDYIEDLTGYSERCYNDYDFYNPSSKLRNFLWEVFASHYVELVKGRAYNSEGNFSEEESLSAKYTLHFLLERLLILLCPIVPRITSFIAREKEINLHDIGWPSVHKSGLDLNLLDEVMEFNRFVWKTKKENSLRLRDSISGIEVPKRLDSFQKDLISTHSLK